MIIITLKSLWKFYSDTSELLFSNRKQKLSPNYQFYRKEELIQCDRLYEMLRVQ